LQQSQIRAKNKALFNVWHYETWRHSEQQADRYTDTVLGRQQPNSALAVILHFAYLQGVRNFPSKFSSRHVWILELPSAAAEQRYTGYRLPY
jgi:hypothetical protein